MVATTYNDWSYSYENGQYCITPPDKKITPNNLYKFYSLSENSVDALTNLYLYASHSYQFNDPFDCNEKIIEYSTWEDIENLLDSKDLYDKLREKFHSLKDACLWAQKAHWNILYRKLGLVSLTECIDNYQMWAIYAQNNGFCLEFDINEFSFTHYGSFPINYVNNITTPIQLSKYGGNLSMLIQTNIKNKWWKYENEWRLYIPNPSGSDFKLFGNKHDVNFYNFGNEHDRKIRYSFSALKSITLGPKFLENLSLHTISDIEFDIECPTIMQNDLYHRVLNFISKISIRDNITIRLASLADFDHFNFMPIQVFNYSEGKYRILFKGK